MINKKKETQSFFSDSSPRELINTPNFFIVGVGRSGTTLLMGLLNAHNQVTMLPELQFVWRILIKNASRIGSAEKMVRILHEDVMFPLLGKSVREVMAPFIESPHPQPYSALAVYQHILQTHKFEQQKPIIGDKSPKVIEHLPVIKSLFPNTRIIHIVRDPRDVFLSRTKADWSKDRLDILQVLACKTQYSLGRYYGEKLFKQQYIEIRYEDLLSKPTDTLQKICKFLSIAYDDKMINFHSGMSQIIPENQMQWHKNVTKPLISNNSEKWRTQLGKSQLILIEDSCKALMNNHHYEPSHIFSTGMRPEKLRLLFEHLSLIAADYLYRRYLERQNARAIKYLQ